MQCCVGMVVSRTVPAPWDWKVYLLMTLWRRWHIRNEVVHYKPHPSMEASKRFLVSYLDLLINIKLDLNADPCNGKVVITYDYMSSIPHVISTEESYLSGRPRSQAGWRLLGWFLFVWWINWCRYGPMRQPRHYYIFFMQTVALMPWSSGGRTMYLYGRVIFVSPAKWSTHYHWDEFPSCCQDDPGARPRQIGLFLCHEGNQALDVSPWIFVLLMLVVIRIRLAIA